MTVCVSGRKVNLSRPVYIGVEADNNVLDLVFTGLPEIGGGQLVTLNWLTDGDDPVGDIEAMTHTESGYAYTVKSGLTQFAGRTVRAYIEVKSGDKSWHTDPFLLDATALPEVESTLEPKDPTIIQQVKDALEQANAAATRAEEAAKRAEEAGGINEDQLQEAVESALSQAKESGEFDGPQGPAGPAGQPGQSGVYVGPEEPTDPDVNVWVDPDGEPDPPKDFELVETFTVTEAGIRAFERKEEPNGEKYCFDKIFIQMRYPIPENDINTGFFELKIKGDSTDLYSGYSTGTTIKSTDRYNLIVTIMAEIDNGVISGRNNVTLNNSLEKSSQNHGPFCKYVGGKKIRQVYILTGSHVPVGTTFEIRGVRADV